MWIIIKWKGFKALSQNVPGKTEDNHETLQWEQSVGIRTGNLVNAQVRSITD
jgi:hypothetical protein